MNTNRTQSEREWRDQAKTRQKLLEALAWRPADRAGLQRWQRRQQRRRMLKNLAALALLQSPAGVDYAKFIGADRGVAIAEARRAVLVLEEGRV